MNNAPNLITDRLRLYNIDDSDASDIVKWRSNPEVYKYFLTPKPITIEGHLNWYYNSYLKDINRIDWMAYDQADNRIGVFGIKRNAEDMCMAEVSYILSPEWYGCGYATEAIEKIVCCYREIWSLKCVVAEIHEDNFLSRKFAERLGFKLDSINEHFAIYKRLL